MDAQEDDVEKDLKGPGGEDTPQANPALPDIERLDRVAAVNAMREFRRQARITLGDISIDELIDDGRRF